MTWSNVGDEPGRLRETRQKNPPRGSTVRTKGNPNGRQAGHRAPESGPARAARLRALAHGRTGQLTAPCFRCGRDTPIPAGALRAGRSVKAECETCARAAVLA